MKSIKEDAGMLEQKWYTVADVAALTGLTDRTIRNYLKEGTLHGKKVGVQWRFTQQNIESLFREADVTEPLTELLDELVADFLHGSQRPQEMECRILDIPCKTEELWKNIVKKLRKQIDEKRGGWPEIAWEYKSEEQMLRVVAAGRPEDTEWLARQVRKGLKKDAD